MRRKGHCSWQTRTSFGKPKPARYWKFDGYDYRVTKAVMIPYTVLVDGNLVKRHILVGYMGVDPFG